MKYAIFLVLVISLFSCKQTPKKEIVYKNYSIKDLKKYLTGDWIEIIKKQNDNEYKYWKFIFSGNDYGRFQDFEKKFGKTISFTDAPSFIFYKSKGSSFIIFKYYIDRWNDTCRIITISNHRLVLLQNKRKLLVYTKVNNEY